MELRHPNRGRHLDRDILATFAARPNYSLFSGQCQCIIVHSHQSSSTKMSDLSTYHTLPYPSRLFVQRVYTPTHPPTPPKRHACQLTRTLTNQKPSYALAGCTEKKGSGWPSNRGTLATFTEPHTTSSCPPQHVQPHTIKDRLADTSTSPPLYARVGFGAPAQQSEYNNKQRLEEAVHIA